MEEQPQTKPKKARWGLAAIKNFLGRDQVEAIDKTSFDYSETVTTTDFLIPPSGTSKIPIDAHMPDLARARRRTQAYRNDARPPALC